MNSTNLTSLFLPKNQTAHYEELRVFIKSSENVQEIHRKCQDISHASGDSIFPYHYAGVLMAKKGLIDEAIYLLDIISDSCAFALALRRYLAKHGTLEIQEKVFDSTLAYDVWCKTSLYLQYNKTAVAEIVASAMKIGTASLEPSIVDIGTGNGVLITNVINKILEKASLNKITLYLVDQSEEMLKAAEAHCRENVSIPLDIKLIHGRIQDLALEELQAQIQNSWFVNGAASLHHMPKKAKIETLQKLSQITDNIFITDFEANHDLPLEDSPEFIYSLAHHMNFVIYDILRSCEAEENKWHCIDVFVLAEALVMLNNTRENRIDYHTSLKEWVDVVEKAGLKVNRKKHLVLTAAGRPVTLFLGVGG